MTRVLTVQPNEDNKIIKLCISGIPKQEALNQFPKMNSTLKVRINRIYRVAFFLQDFYDLKEKNENNKLEKKRSWKMSTYLKHKINLHPSDVESLMNALLEEDGSPRILQGSCLRDFQDHTRMRILSSETMTFKKK
jgi:hypothetical protein